MALNLKLQQLEHQELAVRAVTSAFDGVEFDQQTTVNPVITPAMREVIDGNIETIQKGQVPTIPAIPLEQRTTSNENFLGIDVKMETGTGKTFTFTKLMYELHARYGFNKFILLAPSSAIREGTSNFINSDYADSFFRQHYDSQIALQTLAGAPNNKRGRKMIPTEIREYAEGADFDDRRIDALIMTGAMLTSPTLKNDDYDQTLSADNYESSRPLDIFAHTRPVVIVDEPHRFKRDKKWFEYIRLLNPSMVIRFGATFPELKRPGKTPNTIDYDNLVYDLTSAEAFNRLLVKGVKVQYPAAIDADDTKFKVTSLKNKTLTLRNESTGKSYDFTRLDNNLARVHPSFEGIVLEEVSKPQHRDETVARLSNGIELPNGYTLMAGSFSQSYQEIMLAQALENHFKIERELFERKVKIKPSTLFFIDSIRSYRGDENNEGWLKQKFEELLVDTIKNTIDTITNEGALTPAMVEYIQYLHATLDNPDEAHEGYFAEDVNTKDDAIARRVNDILNDKEKLMSYKDADGNYNVMRFIFSRWTLREGWDLPTVFQIVKMRSSGSETSRLQEVGRGLRLPVNERGDRVTEDADQFFLTYLVDYSEKDFADRLVAEINGGARPVINVHNRLEEVALKRGVESTLLFAEMLIAQFIDPHGNVKEDRQDEFLEVYPEFATGLDERRVRDETKDAHAKQRKAKINPDSFAKLRQLWEQLSEKYVLLINELTPEQLDAGIDLILDDDRLFDVDRRDIIERTLREGDDNLLEATSNIVGTRESNTPLSYGEFLKRAHNATNLPVDVIHRGLVRLNERTPIPQATFNMSTLDRLITNFKRWFDTEFESRFEYAHVGSVVGETKLTDSSGKPRKDVERMTLGRITDSHNKPPEHYLYDVYDWDSVIERETMLKTGTDQFKGTVEVFGKIPTRSIRIPVYSGGTTSPDFMYVINRDGARSVNFVAETKGMDTEDAKRGKEKKAIHSARKFFEQLRAENIDVYFTDVLNSGDIIGMIEKLKAGQPIGVKAVEND